MITKEEYQERHKNFNKSLKKFIKKLPLNTYLSGGYNPNHPGEQRTAEKVQILECGSQESLEKRVK